MGGSVANPSQVSFSVKNIISSNSGDNYFKVEVKTGGVFYFDLLFDGAYDTAWITRCYASSYEKRPMTIKEIGGNTIYSSGCYLTNSVSLSKGTYLIKPDLNSNSGYFYASFSSDGTPASGSPSNPIELKINEDVVIDETMLRNYFTFKGEPGQTLYVDSYLNDSISSIDRTRCREASSGNSYWNHHFVYGMCTGSSCNCDTSIEIPLGEERM